MEKNQHRLAHYAGHFLLLGIAGLLILFSQLPVVTSFVGRFTADLPISTLPTATPLRVMESSAELAPGVSTVIATTVSATASADTSLPVPSDEALVPAPNPRTYAVKLPVHDFETHKVERGETPGIIANAYGISTDSLLGGNSWLSKESNQLQTGVELVILPVDGVLHIVQPGETLDSIAGFYDIPVSEIIEYTPNNLEYPFFRLVPESQLLIPGASIGQFYFTAPKSVGSSGGSQAWEVVGTGTYIWPVNGRCITQFYGGFHYGLDVSMSSGSPAFAADTGTVTYAGYAAGVYYDYGNLIVINHGNGYETFYAHLSSINVFPGQILTQGDLIGYTGNTGRSSGPHLHFEIRNNDFRSDPLYWLPGGVTDCT